MKKTLLPLAILSFAVLCYVGTYKPSFKASTPPPSAPIQIGSKPARPEVSAPVSFHVKGGHGGSISVK